MNVVPICEGSGGTGFGADITGVDLANLKDDAFEAIYRAWLTFGVLRFKGQKLNKDSLQKFSQRFGPLEQIPAGRMTEEQKARLGNLYVTPISNIKVDGKPIGGLGDAEATWHSDMTYVEVPPPASVLLGVEIPQNGGDTFLPISVQRLRRYPVTYVSVSTACRSGITRHTIASAIYDRALKRLMIRETHRAPSIRLFENTMKRGMPVCILGVGSGRTFPVYRWERARHCSMNCGPMRFRPIMSSSRTGRPVMSSFGIIDGVCTSEHRSILPSGGCYFAARS